MCPPQVTGLPTVSQVRAGLGPSGAAPTTHDQFTAAAGANGTAVISSLTPATNYTVSPHALLHLPASLAALRVLLEMPMMLLL